MSRIEEEKLILKVEQNPLLYEPRHPHHKDLNRKEAAWSAMARELGVSSVTPMMTSTVNTLVMFQRLRTEVCGCCVFATALSLLYLFVMPAAFANGLLPCSIELFDLVEDMLKDTNGLSSVDERLYTPSEAHYETCPKSTLSCFAEEAKVLVYHNPALHKAQLTRRLISINTQEDSGNCLQCEVNNMEPVEKFLNTLKNIVQRINGHGCVVQP